MVGQARRAMARAVAIFATNKVAAWLIRPSRVVLTLVTHALLDHGCSFNSFRKLLVEQVLPLVEVQACRWLTPDLP